MFWWIHGLAAVIAILLCVGSYQDGYMEAMKDKRNADDTVADHR
jgi:hypothetical protein